MASRYSGRRVSTIAAEKKRRKTMHSKVSGAHRSSVRQKEVPMTSRERQRLIQLVICGSVFVLLVAVKLLLPGRMSVLNATLSDALQQNMDLQAVFSAVGRTFSGEEDWTGAAEEVYRAVFEPEAGEALETAAHSSGIELKESMPGEAALNLFLTGRRGSGGELHTGTTGLHIGIHSVFRSESAGECQSGAGYSGI